MDTRAFSMARSLRISASAVALVVSMVAGPAFAQNRGDDQVVVPFSSLSASAQQEIIALRRASSSDSVRAPLLLPADQPVARNQNAPFQSAPVMLDDRRLRIGWAIGVYR